jgi:ABC-2 type transport system ATP-binding protein
MNYVIEAKKLTKKYPGKMALDELDLQVNEGEIIGLLGPNGAGKSTLIKIISGTEQFDEGELFLFNEKISKKSRRMIGVAPQENAVYPLLTCYENLIYFGSLYGINGETANERAEELLKKLNLFEKKDVASGNLSGGMRRRLNLACALMHKPKIIILDEPTTGLDPAVRNSMWRTTKEVAKDNKATLLLTTHYLEEAEALCDRIVLINSGKIIADGTPESLKKMAGKEIAKIKSIPGKYDSISNSILEIKGVDEVTITEHGLVIESENISNKIHEITKCFEKNQENIVEFSVSKPSLEDVFLKLTGAKLREGVKDEHTK